MKTVLLGDVAEIVGGGTPSTKNQEYWGGNIPWITPRDLSNHHNVYIKSGERSITETGVKSSSAKLLPKEAVIFSSRAPIGYVTIASHKMTTNQGCKGIVCSNKLNNRYLYYWLKLKKKYIEGLAGGSTFKEISTSGVRGLEIELPSVNEQDKIVEQLETLDEKIELNRRMNETLEKIGQALFRHYFIDNPEAKTWPITTLNDISERVGSGGTPSTKREEFYGGDVDWFSTKELNDNFLKKSDKTITSAGLNNSAAKLFSPKTVVVAIYAAPTVGRLGILTREGSFNQAACGLVANPKYGYEFVYLYLLLSRKDLNDQANGAAQQNISVGAIRTFPVFAPPQEVLDEFRGQISNIFKQIRTNTDQIQSLAELRDSLLPHLISGEIKL